MSRGNPAIDANIAVVRAFYDGAVRKDSAVARALVHPDFVCSAPDYLPWGGTVAGGAKYLDVILPQVGRVLDFGRFSYDSITADEDRVIALINVGVTCTDAMLKISEHITVRDGKMTSIWVAYFEPKRLLEQLLHNTKADAGLI
jgi:ketosteroid isomerase-like protein